jgi:hypothetical protein
MEMQRLNKMQQAYINKTIREVLAVSPVDFDTLMSRVFKKLIPNIEPNSSDKEVLRFRILDLLIQGKIDINKGKISIEGRYRVNSVEEDYKLNNVESPAGEKNINGTTIINSVGSERYPFFWSKLELGSLIKTELIAEPQNKKDPLAVAICIDKKPYAYMPREEASKYHPLIIKANKKDFIIVTHAKVITHPDNKDLKLFQLNVADSPILERHLDRTLF